MGLKHGLGRWAAASAIAIAAAWAGQASAADKALKGIALVIAQSDYESLTDLANPANDAREIQKLLTDLGFEVSSVTDRDRRRLERELERFVEDAEDADVALLYYSGHGIEAGGENYLVPIDATTDALNAADAKLVPLAGPLAQLQRTVPVTIVLLDACRTNPFPPGATLKTAEQPAGLPVTASGLGAPRSVTPMRFSSQAQEETFGMVIGYAAEPGQVALDGEPGGTSPYADALARHLGAMTGEEFGAVLRMVAEEVYLKTGGRQRPWVNESLRRLLYFGSIPEGPAGAQGDILRERRKLLLTIARLGGQTRRQIEDIAASGDVPMDAIYGLLRTLGTDAPNDPAELDKILRGQTEKLKGILADRDAIASTDPEIARLSKLAGEAVAEGAIDTALGLHEDIKRRVGALSQSLDQAQANIRERRKEFAAAYAASSRAYALAFDFERGAADMHSAYEQVRDVDRYLAWSYRVDEAYALLQHGSVKGDNASLAKAIVTYRDALTLTSREAEPFNWALTQNNIGTALTDLGTRLGDMLMIETAVNFHRAALDVYTRDMAADSWAWTQASIANALLVQSEHKDDPDLFTQAIAGYRGALEVRTQQTNPMEWARLEQNLGTGLVGLARRTDDVAVAQSAIASFRKALTQYTRAVIPLEWANTQTNLAAALRLYASLASKPEALDEAIAIYHEVLEFRTRARVPLGWASTTNNLANALLDKARLAKSPEIVRQSIAMFQDTLLEQTLERTPIEWARARRNIATAYEYLYDIEKNPADLDTAIQEYDLALQGWTVERGPADHALTLNAKGVVLEKKADITSDLALYDQAMAAYRAGVREISIANSPSQWSTASNNVALLSYKIGWKTKNLELLRDAAAMQRERLSFRNRARTALDDGQTNYNLGLAFTEAAKLTDDAADRERGIAAYRAALPGYVGPDKAGDRAFLHASIGDQLLELSFAGEADPKLAEDAAAALSAALAESTVKAGSYDPVVAEHQWGRALLRQGELTGARDRFLEALPHFEAAAAGFKRDGGLDDWAISLSQIGLSHVNAGQAGEGTEDLERAIEPLRSAIENLKGPALDATRAAATYNLGLTKELLSWRRGDRSVLEEAIGLYADAAAIWPPKEDPTGWASAHVALGNVLLSAAAGNPARLSDIERASAAFAAAATVFGPQSDPRMIANVQNGFGYARALIGEQSGAVADFDAAASAARLALDAQAASGAVEGLPAIRDTLCRALTGLGRLRGDKALAAEAVAACETAIAEFNAAGNDAGAAETQVALDRARETLAKLN